MSITKTQLVWIPSSIFTGFKYDEETNSVQITTKNENSVHILEICDKDPSFGDTVLSHYPPFYKQYELGDEGDVVTVISSLEPAFTEGYLEPNLSPSYVAEYLDTIVAYTDVLPYAIEDNENVQEDSTDPHIINIDTKTGYGEFVDNITLSDALRKFIIYCIKEMTLSNLKDHQLEHYSIMRTVVESVNKEAVVNRQVVIYTIYSLELCKKIQRELVNDKFGVLYELKEPKKDCKARVWFPELNPTDTAVYVYDTTNVCPTYQATRFPSELDYAITMLKEALFIPLGGFIN